MKRFLFLVSILFAALQAGAQQSGADIIVKTNGEKLQVEVKEVTDESVKFTYVGEAALYSLGKGDIQEIQFKSGRKEIFAGESNKGSQNSNAAVGNTRHENKVAILPFAYVADGQAANNEMSIRVQNECYSYLNSHAGNYKIVDVHTTNALLAKAGISRESMSTMGMDEICNILGVAYVVTGMVTLNKTSQTSYGSNAQNANYKRNDEKKKSSSSSYGSSYATTEQNYQTTLDLGIYNDLGENIYSKNRTAFWHEQDAYKATLEYLLKRSPLYKK